MSKTIDERVVSMKFENSQFESGARQSLSTLDKLKQALNFKGTSAGLDTTTTAVTKTSSEISTLGNTVDTVKKRFSALDVAAITALANITNSAVNAGKRVANALTLEPVLTGFKEYELKMNSVQTIMANVSSKGKTIADVTAVLDELNHYADLTIYNFAEMTRNIGTFTAAGVDLDVAVDAIQGIANLAATSGSTSQQASTAMYQLSQAIAAGTVKLQDWNSVVNAGMGGETFQNGLKQTAREMGIAVDQIIKDSGSFRESLSKGWMTAEVLNTTLKKFTVDGAKEYAAAMEASGQYTAEQSAEVIKQAQIMEDAATKIKTFTQLWDVLKESAQSGWAATWEAIIGDFEEAKETISQLGDMLTGLINSASDARNTLLTAALGSTELVDAVDGMTGRELIWESLFNILNAVGDVLGTIRDAFRDVFPPVTAQQIYDLIAGFHALSESLQLSDTQLTALKTAATGFFSIIKLIADAVIHVGSIIFDVFGNALGVAINTILDGASRLASIATSLTSVLSAVGEGVGDLSISGETLSRIIGFVLAGSFVKFMATISGSMKQIVGFKNDIHETVTTVLSLRDGVKKLLSAFAKQASTAALLNVAAAIGILAISLVAIASIPSDKLVSAGAALAGLAAGLSIFVAIMDRIGDLKKLAAVSTAIVAMSASILTLSVALKLISTVDASSMVASLVAIEVLMGSLVGVARLLSAKSLSSVLKAAVAMGTFSAAMLVLSTALSVVGNVAAGGHLLSSMAAIETLMVSMVGITALIGRLKMSGVTKSAIAMIAFATAIGGLASALSKISSIQNTGTLVQSVLALEVIMASMVAMSNTLRGVKITSSISSAISMIALAQSMKMIADAIADISSMPIGGLASSVLALVATTTALTLLSKQVGKIPVANTVGLIAMSIALNLLASAIKIVLGIEAGSVTSVVLSLVTFVVILKTFVDTTNKIAKTSLRATAALTSISTMLVLMAVAIKTLSGISPVEAATAVVSITAMSAVVMRLTDALTKVKPIKIRNLTSIALITAVLAELTAVMAILAGMDPANALGAAGGLATLIGSLSLLMVALGAMPKLKWSSLASIQVLIALIGEISLLLYGLSKLDVYVSDSMINNLMKLTGMFTALYAVMGGLSMLSKFGFNAKGALASTAGIMGVAAVITTFLTALGTINDALSGRGFDVMSKLESGIDVLKRVCSGLGELVGSIVNGFTTSATADLALVGTRISEFSSSIANINPDSITGFKALMEGLGDLYKSEVFKSVAGLLGADTSFDKLGDELTNIGDGVKQFAASVDGITPEQIEPGVKAINAIAGLQDSIKPVGGIATVIHGDASLTSFGSELKTFADNLVEAVKAFDNDAFKNTIGDGVMDNVVSSATELAKLSDVIDPIGGLNSMLEGSSDLGAFGTTLVPFADGISAAFEVFSGMTAIPSAEQLQSVVDAVTKLGGLSSGLTDVGGLGDLFTGSTDLDDFAKQLPTFAELISTTFAALEDVTIDESAVAKIDNVSKACQKLADLQNNLPTQQTAGGKLLSGDSSLSGFAKQVSRFMTDIGEAFSSFTDVTIDETVVTTVDNLASVCKKLAEVQATVQNGSGGTGGNALVSIANGVKQLKTAFADFDAASVTASAEALKKLSSFAQEIANMDMSGFDTFGTELTNVAKSSVDEFVLVFEGAKGRVSSAVTGMVSAAATGISGAQGQIDTAMGKLVANVAKKITEKEADVRSAGTELGKAAGTGIEQASTSVSSSVDTLMSSAANAVKDSYNRFKSAGAYAAAGMADGIKSKQGQVVAAAKALAAAAENAARVSLDINSPSRVFSEIGEYVCAGMAKGIKDNTGDVTKQCVATAKATVEAFQRELEINSPSKVTRDKVGKYIVDGIAEGIEKNMSAEEAAAKKAENICNAFRDEIDKFDLRSTTDELEYKLWQAFNPNASDAQKSSKEAEYNEKRVAILAEKATLAQGKYETMLVTLGKDADETREAYNEFLQAQLNLIEVTQELTDNQTNLVDANREAFKAANELYTQVMPTMEKLGYTQEEIWKFCAEKFGYKDTVSMLDQSLQNTQNAAQQFDSAMASASGTYKGYTEAIGKDTAFIYTTGQSIQEAAITTEKAVESIADAGATTPLVDTISSLEQLATVLNNVAASANGSKVAAEVANALALMPENVEGAAETTVDSFLEALNQLLDACEKNDMLDPVITPVVDLTDAYAKFEQLNRMFNSIGGTAAGTTTGTISTSVKNTRGAATGIDNTGRVVKNASYGLTKPTTSVMITQNNYSPKALNRSDIYRDTKNLISTAKKSAF